MKRALISLLPLCNRNGLSFLLSLSFLSLLLPLALCLTCMSRKFTKKFTCPLPHLSSTSVPSPSSPLALTLSTRSAQTTPKRAMDERRCRSLAAWPILDPENSRFDLRYLIFQTPTRSDRITVTVAMDEYRCHSRAWLVHDRLHCCPSSAMVLYTAANVFHERQKENWRNSETRESNKGERKGKIWKAS